MFKLFDLLFNKLPLLKLLDGKKTAIAATLFALAEALNQVAPYFGVKEQAALQAAIVTLRQVAAILGGIGVAGKIAKKDSELIKKTNFA